LIQTTFPDYDQSPGFGKRKRFQQNPVDDAEYRAICADTQAERKDCNPEAPILGQQPLRTVGLATDFSPLRFVLSSRILNSLVRKSR
jgi:hypothetical protein